MKIIIDKRRAIIAGAVITLLTAAPIAYAIFTLQLSGTVPTHIHPAAGARFDNATAAGIPCVISNDLLSFTCPEIDTELGSPFTVNASITNPNHELTFNATMIATSSNSTVATISPSNGTLSFGPQTTTPMTWLVQPVNPGNTTLSIHLNETGT
jgi:hypothetical protein